MNRSGFSLIEMAVYSALVPCMALIAFSWMNGYLNTLTNYQAKNSSVLAVHTALQRLSDDISMADAAEHTWVQEPALLQLYLGKQKVVWHKEKDKLYRSCGNSKSLIANQIQSFASVLTGEKNAIKTVTCKIKAGHYMASRCTRVCNE